MGTPCTRTDQVDENSLLEDLLVKEIVVGLSEFCITISRQNKRCLPILAALPSLLPGRWISKTGIDGEATGGTLPGTKSLDRSALRSASDILALVTSSL